jgi:hypothetical protein
VSTPRTYGWPCRAIVHPPRAPHYDRIDGALRCTRGPYGSACPSGCPGAGRILQPEDPWEITGYVHNVVFTCGAVPEPDGTVKVYWGGADTVMCVGEANMSDLVGLCLEHGRSAK